MRTHEPVERIGHLDLAGQAAVLAHVEGEIEHVFFHLLRRPGRLAPGVIDIDMAGGAGAGAATFGVDAGHQFFTAALHHRHAGLRLDDAFGSVVLNKGDLGHGIGGLR